MAAPPKPSFAECDRIITAEGSPFETLEVVIEGRRQKIWKHVPDTFRAYFEERMKHYADRVIVNEPDPRPSAAYDDRREITYGRMLENSYSLGAWMRERGVQAGDKVAVGGINSIGWLTAYVALHLIGAVPVCLNSTLTQDVQIHCLNLTKPKLVFVDSGDAEVLGPVAGVLDSKGVGQIYSWNDIKHLSSKAQGGLMFVDFNHLPVSAEAVDQVKKGVGFDGVVHPESDGLVLFTSGTTSLPKGVLITQRQGSQHVLTACVPVARAALRAGAPAKMALDAAITPLPEQTTALMPVPLFHVTGLLASMTRMFHIGARMVFMRRWSVPDAVKLLVNFGIRSVGGVPSIATAILQSGLLPDDYVMDAVSYGGAAPPKRLADDVRKRFPNAFINHGWGMTEASGLHIAISGQDYIDRPEAVGLAIPIGGMRIVDMETREPVPPNTLGMLHINGGNIMKAYLNNPKANREAFVTEADGTFWFDTGDVGIIDEDGVLYLRDRAKDMIIRGGENIASAEVENAVTLDSRLAEVAAVAVPDPVLGERVGLGVSLAPGMSATPASIIAEAEKRLRHPARPVIVVIFDELPRNANGKILKNDVKDVVAKAWDKQGGVPASPPKARM